MTAEQIIVFVILGTALLLFIWGKWRYDLVALVALFAAVVSGVVPAEKAFTGLADPVVTTVGSILILSAAISRSGFIDWVTKLLGGLTERPRTQLAFLLILITLFSAFMNNVGALAVFLPIAIAAAKKANRSQSELLMPLAFSSLLGGLVTLIGTPPNLVIAGFRNELTGAPFRMFDFAPVGAGLAVLGIVYLVFARRFMPKERPTSPSSEEMFEIDDYVSEVSVPPESTIIGKTFAAAEKVVEGDLTVVGLIRDGKRQSAPSRRAVVREGDTLLVESNQLTLKRLIDFGKLKIAGSDALKETQKDDDDVGTIEAIVMKGSELINASPREMYLRSRYGVHLLAVRRAGHSVRKRMSNVKLQESDVIVLQGRLAGMPEVLASIGCLPLAQRNLQIDRGRKFFMPIIIMAVCIALASFEALPASIAFLGGVLVIGIFRVLRVAEMYEALDGSIIILLAALIPVTQALQTTGGDELISSYLMNSVKGFNGPAILCMTLVTTMLVTPFLNNVAAVLVMAPIAASLAIKLGLNVDPFLMAVAVGASCDFLTPIGHQSNTLVMVPGGYKFGDYWRLGLPLSILVVVVGTPLIMMVWPLH